MEPIAIHDVLLETLHALLGEVTPQLRAVQVNLCHQTRVFSLYFYYEGEASEKFIDRLQCVATEAWEIPLEYSMNEKMERIDLPEPIPQKGRLVYLRREQPLDPRQHPQTLGREFIPQENTSLIFKNPNDEISQLTSLSLIHRSTEGQIAFSVRPSNYKIPFTPAAYSQLSVQRAILGKITPQLRAVITDIIEDKTLFIRFYSDGLVADEVLYSWEVAMTQSLADFGPEYILDGKIEQIDYPQKLPLKPRSVYRRFEAQYLL